MEVWNVSGLWVLDPPMTFFGGEGGQMWRERGWKASAEESARCQRDLRETKLPYLPHCTSEPCHDMSVLEGPEINKRKNFKNHSISSWRSALHFSFFVPRRVLNLPSFLHQAWDSRHPRTVVYSALCLQRSAKHLRVFKRNAKRWQRHICAAKTCGRGKEPINQRHREAC